MAAKKVYRKEDILRMQKNNINAEWAKKGASNSILYGYVRGGDCRHKWFRRIYAQVGSKASANDPIITTTKARSNGFRPEANEQQVPVAPKNMKNRGYVTKNKDKLMAVLFISEETIKKSTTINGNVDVELFLPYIKVAQDIHIHQLLGVQTYTINYKTI